MPQLLCPTWVAKVRVVLQVLAGRVARALLVGIGLLVLRKSATILDTVVGHADWLRLARAGGKERGFSLCFLLGARQRHYLAGLAFWRAFACCPVTVSLSLCPLGDWYAAHCLRASVAMLVLSRHEARPSLN